MYMHLRIFIYPTVSCILRQTKSLSIIMITMIKCGCVILKFEFIFVVIKHGLRGDSEYQTVIKLTIKRLYLFVIIHFQEIFYKI